MIKNRINYLLQKDIECIRSEVKAEFEQKRLEMADDNKNEFNVSITEIHYELVLVNYVSAQTQ